MYEVKKVEVASRDFDGCSMRGFMDKPFQHAQQIVNTKYIVNSLGSVLDTLFMLTLIVL